jgi:hypothetical protein
MVIIIPFQIYTWVNNVESIDSDGDKTPVKPVEVGLVRNYWPRPPISELCCAIHGSNKNADGAETHPTNHCLHILAHRTVTFLALNDLLVEGCIVFPAQEKFRRQTNVDGYSNIALRRSRT